MSGRGRAAMAYRTARHPAGAGHEPESWSGSHCDAMRVVLARARTVAATRATVLLTGETGVGKGVLARQIHGWSNRRAGPFVAVHCGAVAESLLESELFGHERGAFTGAERQRMGKFELADGGTLFLDEIGTISPAVQVTLLDAIQERCFHRVGGEEDVAVDIRIIAATNGDLDRMQREGRFRRDLYHRLNVFPLEIPPLRDRREDLPALTAHLLARLNREYGKNVVGVAPDVAESFRAYAWPGNVRELENVLERALILESSPLVTERFLPAEIVGRPRAAAATIATDGTLAAARRAAVCAAERRYLCELLAAHEGRAAPAAQAAGVSTRQLRKLLARHGIDRREFGTARRPPASAGRQR